MNYPKSFLDLVEALKDYQVLAESQQKDSILCIING